MIEAGLHPPQIFIEGIIMGRKFAEIAYTESVKSTQELYNSRYANRKLEDTAIGANDELTEAEMEFISTRDTFFMASVGENGWPYIQHRGGPKGFLKVVDSKTMVFPDFRGNLQFISVGNIHANERVSLFLLDFATKRRLKVWARAEVIDLANDNKWGSIVDLQDYEAKIERAVVLKVEAFDWNCPQHIVRRFSEEEVIELQKGFLEHIDKLESEIENLKKQNVQTRL